MLERLGEFAIKKQLGEGGMGAVYLAYQESLDREVALKVLSDRLCRDEKFIARFKREARSAASIVHPNVIQIYSIGEQPTPQGEVIHYFAMEFVRGRDLAEILGEGRIFSVAEALDIVLQVAQACACAGDAGIVHRDLKPANIMIGDRGMVKVTDFGLAKGKSSDLDVTEAGTIVGTANYMSPEQGRGLNLDARSDIYSLGVVFFELLTRRVPFIADQPSAVLYMHVYEPPPPPSQFNSEVPPAVDRMVLRMLAKDPAERPVDADELLRELEALKQTISGQNKSSSVVMPVGETALPQGVHSPGGAEALPESLRGVPPGKLSALVADDLASVRKLYCQVLTELGFKIFEAADGETALALWREHRPQLVLLDLNMPKLDGLALLRRRQDEKLGGQVLVLSAQSDRDTVAGVALTGACSYIVKPVNIHELRARIGKIMALPEARLAVNQALAPSRTSAPPPPTGTNQSRQILVLDSTAYARALYRGILEAMGHQVAGVETPAEFSAITAEDSPDLAVLAVSGGAPETLALARELRTRPNFAPLILIVGENETALVEPLRAEGFGAVLQKPMRLDQFRGAVTKLLSASGEKSRPGLVSSRFSQLVERQLARDHAYTLVDLARELSAFLPEGARASFEKRLQDGSLREIQTAALNLLRRLKTEKRLDLAMRHVRQAYQHGNVEVRNFCLAALPELLERADEIDVLLALIGDEDFRIRCQVLRRLGELRAEEGLSVIVRFLNDDVWKVRKAAAACLEAFDLRRVLEPLVIFYSRSGESLPDKIRARFSGNTGLEEMNLLEEFAARGGIEVRTFVAGLLGETHSKLAVRLLLPLLRDPEPKVRAAAARSCGRVRSDKLRDALLATLPDRSGEVQAAAIEALAQYPLTTAAQVFLGALEGRGRRIAEDAVRFLVTVNQDEKTLEGLLANLARQPEVCRKYLSLLLSYILPDSAVLGETVRLLGAATPAERARGAHQVESALQEFQRALARKRRLASRGW